MSKFKHYMEMVQDIKKTFTPEAEKIVNLLHEEFKDGHAISNEDLLKKLNQITINKYPKLKQDIITIIKKKPEWYKELQGFANYLNSLPNSDTQEDN